MGGMSVVALWSAGRSIILHSMNLVQTASPVKEREGGALGDEP